LTKFAIASVAVTEMKYELSRSGPIAQGRPMTSAKSTDSAMVGW
jgi:hypothetical protein